MNSLEDRDYRGMAHNSFALAYGVEWLIKLHNLNRRKKLDKQWVDDWYEFLREHLCVWLAEYMPIPHLNDKTEDADEFYEEAFRVYAQHELIEEYGVSSMGNEFWQSKGYPGLPKEEVRYEI